VMGDFTCFDRAFELDLNRIKVRLFWRENF
jgi:hypothetical protein